MAQRQVAWRPSEGAALWSQAGEQAVLCGMMMQRSRGGVHVVRSSAIPLSHTTSRCQRLLTHTCVGCESQLVTRVFHSTVLWYSLLSMPAWSRCSGGESASAYTPCRCRSSYVSNRTCPSTFSQNRTRTHHTTSKWELGCPLRCAAQHVPCAPHTTPSTERSSRNHPWSSVSSCRTKRPTTIGGGGLSPGF